MSRAWAVYLITILLILAGCGLNATRTIVPVPEPDLTILLRTKGIAATKGEISIAVVPLPDVKELDGFGILIANESKHWISFEKKDCVLIQGGEARQPMSKSQTVSRLGGSYKASMPNELSADIYRWRQSVNLMRKRAREMDSIIEDKEISVMGGTKETVYFYFSTQGNMAPMQFIIPNIYNEATGQRTRFSFKFNVEKTS
ncbi:hypothetical protein ACFL6S_35265 [Candidatus Poribacteria bacterium]